jgi:hypothetical protein
MLVFLQRSVKPGEPALFGAQGTPTQLLVLDGFARPIAFDDVDGDGLPDLVAGSVRPDLIDGLRAAASERIEAELYVYRNTGNGFSKRPDLVHKISIQAGGLDLTARFAGDVTGDGVSDFIERADKNALRVHMVRKTREGLTIVERPIYEMPLADDARVLMPGRLAKGTWDLFVIEKEAVRCASFRLSSARWRWRRCCCRRCRRSRNRRQGSPCAPPHRRSCPWRTGGWPSSTRARARSSSSSPTRASS